MGGVAGNVWRFGQLGMDLFELSHVLAFIDQPGDCSGETLPSEFQHLRPSPMLKMKNHEPPRGDCPPTYRVPFEVSFDESEDIENLVCATTPEAFQRRLHFLRKKGCPMSNDRVLICLCTYYTICSHVNQCNESTNVFQSS